MSKPTESTTQTTIKLPQEAIALRYDPQQESSPRVLAKGRGPIAERILQSARENNVPLYEDQDLIQLLSVLDINAEIPASLYKALAEVLSHIYRANNTLAKKNNT